MHIFITGNMGYIGPVLIRHLRGRFPNARMTGYDSGFFAHCLTDCAVLPENVLDRQIFGDVRDLTAGHLQGVDAVIHLAAISNDPMGNRFEAVTGAINQNASLHIANLARTAGVGSFVFASSCSVYGFAADGTARREEDPLNPLTAYARSKIGTEHGLRELANGDRANGDRANGDMAISCLRFATACGMSPRLRLDLVVNDFVASACATGRITVLSDGTPWRPLIDVRDMARAMEWAILRRPEQDKNFLAVNVGSDEWNYQVADLAKAVGAAIPGTEISINTSAPPDKRSYKVDFALFRSLAPDFQPQIKLNDSIAAIRDGLRHMGFADDDFRSSQAMRLRVLEDHIATKRLSEDLRWQI